MPLIGRWEQSAEISGPVCPNGGHMRASVQVASEAGQVVITGYARCTNACLTDNLEPSVQIDIVNQSGHVVSSMALDLPVVPGKGWPWNGNPERQVGSSLTIANSIVIKEIRFAFRNRSHGSVLLEVVKFAAEVAVAIL